MPVFSFLSLPISLSSLVFLFYCSYLPLSGSELCASISSLSLSLHLSCRVLLSPSIPVTFVNLPSPPHPTSAKPRAGNTVHSHQSHQAEECMRAGHEPVSGMWCGGPGSPPVHLESRRRESRESPGILTSPGFSVTPISLPWSKPIPVGLGGGGKDNMLTGSPSFPPSLWKGAEL